jgi:peptide/nickel transport system permease protein
MAVDEEYKPDMVSSRRLFLRRLVRNPGAVIGLVMVAVMVGLALFAPWVASHDPNETYPVRLAEPSGEFLLGTDNIGRDIFSRLVYGARPSIGSAAVATTIILLIGVTVGVASGYIGGLFDDVSMRIVDILQAFPLLILALAIIGILGPGLQNVLLAVILVVWASYARLVRGIVLEIREQEFVMAAVSMGGSRLHIIVKHILPNIISPVLVLASLQMGFLLLTISGLSFLGLGIQPPTAEWGAMLNDGRNFFQVAPQLMIYPGIMITLTVLGFSLLGDGLRDVLDPKQVR